MRHYKNILLQPNSTIKEALYIIDTGAKQIALVVDKDEKLIGTLTDGDIRRGLLNNLSLDDSIETIISKNPTVCTMEDTKEDILEIAISKKLYQIPLVDNNGKLIDIKVIDDLLKPKNKPNKVILMVGGLGTRLRPLTDDIPKPMLKVGNKPILETIILNFKKYGFINIILCVNYKSDIIKKYFKNGKDLGVNIEYIYEDKRMGTAGALSLLTDEQRPIEPFFVMNGDLLTNINFEHFLSFHQEQKAKATMAVREYDFQIPYGVVNIKDGKIKALQEKPIQKFFVNAGIYMLDSSTIQLIPKDKFYDMPTLFEKLISIDETTISFPLREYWLDIGQIEDYKKANYEYHEVF
ncbi:MAG: nucleotidyltransferase family protein [Campylobacterales bacterium]